MQILQKASLFLLVFTSFNCFGLSEKLNPDNVQQVKIEESFGKHMYNNSIGTPLIRNLCELSDYIEIINEFIRPEYYQLMVVIADDMRDAIKTAEKLGEGNRLLPIKRQNLSYKQDLLYNEIVQNYYIYYNERSSFFVYVHPRNHENDILTAYMAKRTIGMINTTKVVLTCDENYDDIKVDRMFKTASNIVQATKETKNTDIVFIPVITKSNIESKLYNFRLFLRNYCKAKFQNSGLIRKLKDDCQKGLHKNNTEFMEQFDEIQKSFTVQENLEYLACKRSIYESICENSSDKGPYSLLGYLSETLYKTLEFNHSLNFNLDTETWNCFKEQIETIGLDDSRVNMSTLTGVLAFSDILHSSYYFLSTLENIEDLCRNIKYQTGIVKQLCRIKLPNSEPYYRRMIIDSLKRYLIHGLGKKSEWYRDLKLMYDSADNWSESFILYKLKHLSYVMYKMGGKGLEIMKNAFDTVKKNTIRTVADISCTSLNDGYKLQAKGKFIKLSKILYGNRCAGQITSMEFLALDKIIIDQDITSVENEIHVSIISPNWEVVFKRNINGNGTSASTDDFHWLPIDIVKPFLETGQGVLEISAVSRGNFFGIIGKSIEGKISHILTESDHDKKGGAAGNHNLIKLFSLSNSTALDIVSKGQDQQLNKQTVLENFVNTVIEYKKYLLLNSNGDYSSSYMDLYYKLKNIKEIPSNYRTLHFLHELSNLEDYYFINSDRNFTLPLLKLWREEFIKYNDHRKENEKSDYYTEFFSLLDTMILSKIWKLENDYYNIPILRLEAYVDALIIDNDELEKIKNLNNLNTISSKFKETLQKQINEANNLIGELQVFVQNAMKELKKEIDDLVIEIQDKIKHEKQRTAELEEKKKELESKIALRAMFAVFQGIFLALSFINPVCAVVGAVLSTGASIVESQVLSKSPSIPAEIKLPSGVANAMKINFERFDKKKKNEIDEIEKTLSKINLKKELLISQKENIEPLNGLETSVKDLKKRIKDKKRRLNDNLELVLSNEEEKWNEKTKLDNKYKKSTKAIAGISYAMEAVNLGVDYANKIQGDLSEIDQMKELIKKSKQKVKQLEDFKEKVERDLEPIIDDIGASISTKFDEFAVSSVACLEFKKWQLDEILAGVSYQLDSVTKGFEVNDKIRETLRKLKSAISAVTNIHTLIKGFQEKIIEAEHLNEMFRVQFETTNINIQELKTPWRSLKLKHCANNILDEYQKLKNSFLQHTFPFINEFYFFIGSPIQKDVHPIRTAMSTIDTMDNIKAKLRKRVGHAQQLKKETTQARFGDGGDLPPFYTWNSSLHSSEITNLFKGRKVNLYANIFEKYNNFSAVRFSSIGIQFSCSDPKDDTDLKNDLRGLSVKIVHNGDSYYRCKNKLVDKVHLIKSAPADLSKMSFRSKRKRFVEDSQLDFVLSPFATWSVSLKDLWGYKDFSVLTKYVEKVQIELVGEGQFSEFDDDICQNDFSKYYGKEVRK